MAQQTAFVTGATGLLGNNLVRALLDQGYRVKALVRSRAKAEKQLHGLADVEFILGDMQDVAAFAQALAGCDVLFHTAAFFRDNYKGGSHWAVLEQINVLGTAELIAQAYAQGVRRFVQTSSIAVLDGPPGSLVDETHLRALENADDYYRSKILADRKVADFLLTHPDMFACFVLPGWMWGPGDSGPTSSGQTALDTVNRKIPGLVPGSFSVVDARDVALIQIAAAQHGRRGERYLAAGRHMTMATLIGLIGRLAAVPTPTRRVPLPLLYVIAGVQEVYARLTGKPVLLSLSTVRLLAREADRSHFDAAKTLRELQVDFRPTEVTVADTLQWLKSNAQR